jgi:hypothetical protein
LTQKLCKCRKSGVSSCRQVLTEFDPARHFANENRALFDGRQYKEFESLRRHEGHTEPN